MATKHTTLLWLPDALRDAGIPFRVLAGWDTNRQGYYWTDEANNHHGYYGDPNGHVLHHTATAEYTANVKNSKGQTKANVYAGLGRPGTTRMYSTGGGTPRLDIASGGPANYGNGAGHRKVLSAYVAKDRRFPGPLRKFDRDAADDYYANRYFIGTEIIHLGDGSELHPGVFEMVSQFAAILEEYYGWDERHIGHEDSTRRKVDPRFEQGAPYTMSAFRSRIVELKGSTPPPPPEEKEMPPLPVRQGDGYKDMPADYPFPKDWKDATWKSVIAEYQRDFNRFPEVKVKLTTDGAYGPKTSAALDAILGSISILDGTFLSGNGWSIVRAELRAMEGGGEHGHPDLTAKDAALEAKIAAQAGHDHDERYAKADDHAALLGRYNGHHHDVPAGTVPTRRTEGPNT